MITSKDMKNLPLPNEFYKHYKGGTYQVISLANHTETGEVMVIYKSINFGTVFARPLEDWNSKTENSSQPRFEKINNFTI